jgi:hypothetical protein
MTNLPTSLQAISIDFVSGYCPVQGQGRIHGKPFYFRARGNKWQIWIGKGHLSKNPEWFYEEPYGTEPYEAGWMTGVEAHGFIVKAERLYREQVLEVA